MRDLTPRISIVVPTFNEAPHIIRASLESIQRQTFTDYECIVVDESTQPELAEYCRVVCSEDSRFVYIHPNERLGLAKSLNLAISMSRGNLIARFDSDDICISDRLALQVAFLDAHPEVSLVGGALEIINSEGNTLAHRLYPESSSDIAKGMQVTNTIAHPTVMFRKEVFERYGGYNGDYRFSEDLELWLRWLNAGLKFANLQKVLVQYRQDSTCRNQKHWRYNLKARISNFCIRYLIIRILGIAAIAFWAVLPNPVQEFFFKLLILQRRNQGVPQ
ncbi:glycosyltransferase [Chromobacterium paludis]|uniref:Glycosyltransferase n=1 Tax=Chromobacterium paludis TaxID=2605945 RepID=A0A5C1DLZ6_9NEIS|nr:glycosyltransferase [Chromobacterium paludis]QEL57711.1 glycosyltransferase [Chromobacterium paludis]